MTSYALFEKLLPLLCFVFLGFVAGFCLKTHTEGISRLVIYIFAPIVVFVVMARAPLSAELFIIPLFFIAICAILDVLAYMFALRMFTINSCKIIGLAAGNGNSGYYGIPVGIALFGEQALPYIVLSSVGFTVAESTIGFYLISLGKGRPIDSIKKVLQLPLVYAVFAGLLCNFAGISIPEPVNQVSLSLQSAYTVLGMMLVGIGAVKAFSIRVEWGFVAYILSFKFILWPVVTGGLLALDMLFLQTFNGEVRQILFFMSTIPMAANTVAYASLFDARPEQASFVVLLSTVLALLLWPMYHTIYSVCFSSSALAFRAATNF